MKITEMKPEDRTGISFEIFPPKHDSYLSDIDETLKILCALKPDYISVTFGAGGSLNRNRTVEIAKKILHDYHVEPLVHLTCLNYDRGEIDQFADELKKNGILNVLALRGDHREGMPEKNDFRHASDLIAYLKQKKDFCIAGACYPEGHPESPDRVADILNLKKKVDAGADFLISQLFFDNRMFTGFTENCRIAGITVPVTPGIIPVINKSQIERMVTMCGATLPGRFRRIIDRYAEKKDALFDAGMNYAIGQMIDLLAGGVTDLHIYTMNNARVAARMADGIRNLM
jgi:methylenetetrahydrofolate reductase (NADPH)